MNTRPLFLLTACTWLVHPGGPRIITAETRTAMRQILANIQNGAFAEEWIEESGSGEENLLRMREETGDHPIEEIGERLRKMLPWLDSK